MLNKRTLLLDAALLLAAVLVLQARAAQPAAQMTIHADQPGLKISPMLYGIFFEEINHAGDGGLYAELIPNRSFEDGDKPEFWHLVTTGARKGEMALDTQHPMSPKNPHALRLTIDRGTQGRGVVANDGYAGIALQKGDVYDLSLSARAAGFTGAITVSLEDATDRQIYAQTTIDGLPDSWQSFHRSLTAADSTSKARLVISADRPGTVWLDMVSLFPQKTWKGRPNGMQRDLAAMLDKLHPAFMRFPGGGWIDGEQIRTALRWKSTIGDIADRRTQWDLWGYYSSNGLGYYEYLQLCEDLGAEPLFVINCGMAARENVPMNQMDEWVQDALDAIEYANGPVDSKWGLLRAKAGHPAPFNLKYIEIGNECGGPAYQERYLLFYDAIKAQYPKMVVISDCPTTRRPADIIDEHYYSDPEFFISHANQYDDYSRKGPKVYVGEYACSYTKKDCGRGNLRAALAEAAFMTGMERNSDVVVMSSYAPLFRNVDLATYTPDLINFDNFRVYGTPSYYAEKMFAENRGETVLPLNLQCPSVKFNEPTSGGVALGTWGIQTEFKDLRVIAGKKTLLDADFSQGLGGWKTTHGQWTTKDGMLCQSSLDGSCFIKAGDTTWSNYTFSLKARKIAGDEGFSILFRVRNDNPEADHCFLWNVGMGGNREQDVEERFGSSHFALVKPVPGHIETNRWYDMRVDVDGDQARCYLDEKLVYNVSLARPRPALYAVASRAEDGRGVIVKVVNISQATQDAAIDLRGIEGIQPTAKAIVLTSASPDDENSLNEPTKVAPVEHDIANASTNFNYVFSPNSVTILRLTVK